MRAQLDMPNETFVSSDSDDGGGSSDYTGSQDVDEGDSDGDVGVIESDSDEGTVSDENGVADSEDSDNVPQAQ